MTALLEIHDLNLRLDRTQQALLKDVRLSIAPCESLALVGESGSGKSLTARCVLGLKPSRSALTGEVRFAGESVLDMKPARLQRLRSADISMIFQDPRAHINPVRTVGDHLTETMRYIEGRRPGEARERAVSLLEDVLIDDPIGLLSKYPHQLSGGMLQRVMIAGALAGSPRLLLADEPTTALDVTTQAEVMAILGELRREHDMAMLFITHDLELAAATCDRTAVMYAGRVVEVQGSLALHQHPRHPYTSALLAARPSLELQTERLSTIQGKLLSAAEISEGCAFASRCRFVEEACITHPVPLRRTSNGAVACRRSEELNLSQNTRRTG